MEGIPHQGCIPSERTGTDFSAVKHQSHQPSSSVFFIKSKRGILQISSEHTLSPTLMDPTLVSVVRAVDGQETGLSVQPAEKKNRLKSGQEFHLQSALVQASLPLKQQPAGQQKRTRPLTSYPVSQSRAFTKLVTCSHRPVTKFIT